MSPSIVDERVNLLLKESSLTAGIEFRLGDHARRLGEQLVQTLGDVLTTKVHPELKLLLTGSLVSGTYAGQKPSRNTVLNNESVIEIDLFVLLPEGLSPHSDILINQIKQETGFDNPRKLSFPLLVPHKPEEITSLYGYPQVNYLPYEGRVVEVEMNLAPASAMNQFLDPSYYWDKIFTIEERNWLRDSRRIGRENTTLLHESPGGVLALKTYQLALARGRIIAGYAIGLFDNVTPEVLNPVLERWNNYFEPPVPELKFSLPDKPKSPIWVDLIADKLIK